MSEELDRRFMARAVREARKGRPSPNPHVGAVIARGETLISVGHHQRAGTGHAEVNAIEGAGEAARGATLYCTLEPCNHFGRTPPCTDAIIAAGLARVVIGNADPKPHVPGAVAKLVNAGIAVTMCTDEDSRALIADFTRHITTGLPYATLKAAMTLDGRIATRTGDSKWITGEAARKRAHRMRDQSDAILVGVGTVLADDPELTVRHVRGRDPIRVILDTHLRTPPEAKVVVHASKAPTWIFHGPGGKSDLARDGVELIEAPLAGEHLDVNAVLRLLGKRDVVRLLVEGGARVHGALLAAGLYDAAAVFVARRILGDSSAMPLVIGTGPDRIADSLRLNGLRATSIDGDVLLEGEVARAGPP